MLLPHLDRALFDCRFQYFVTALKRLPVPCKLVEVSFFWTICVTREVLAAAPAEILLGFGS